MIVDKLVVIKPNILGIQHGKFKLSKIPERLEQDKTKFESLISTNLNNDFEH